MCHCAKFTDAGIMIQMSMSWNTHYNLASYTPSTRFPHCHTVNVTAVIGTIFK